MKRERVRLARFSIRDSFPALLKKCGKSLNKRPILGFCKQNLIFIQDCKH
ncbi:hypothetical protein YDYSY3_20660 [Paenibacillus chitinolyticus]|nr:hypothetical protein YDYSY3_20660 [Paenibacillus chitinolyticus]